MTKKVYVASSWRCEHQPAVVERLRAEGFDAYDFRHPAPEDNGFSWRKIDPGWLGWTASQFAVALQHPVAEHGFANDINALRDCDACVMVQPCGRSAALELGYAAGVGKFTVVLLAEGQEPELMLKVADHLCLTLDDVVAALRNSQERKPITVPEQATTPILVVVESPYAVSTEHGLTVEGNLEYLAACMRDCLQRGESPYASHGLYTRPGCLDDDVPEERERGIAAGLAWGDRAQARVVYTDLGISEGMKRGIDRAHAIGQMVEHRALGWAPRVVQRRETHVVQGSSEPSDYICIACAGGVAAAEVVAIPSQGGMSRTAYAHPRCQERAREFAKKDGYAAAVHGSSR